MSSRTRDEAWVSVLRRSVRTEEGCWIFQGSVNPRGYGQTFADGALVGVHRLALTVRGTVIPAGFSVDHQCHNSDLCRLGDSCPHRRCVNPDHLAIVTARANSQRRHAIRHSAFVNVRPLGSGPGANLAAYLMAHIRTEGWSERQAADEFGLTRTTLRRRLRTGDFLVREVSLIARRLGMTTAALTEKAVAA